MYITPTCISFIHLGEYGFMMEEETKFLNSESTAEIEADAPEEEDEMYEKEPVSTQNK